MVVTKFHLSIVPDSVPHNSASTGKMAAVVDEVGKPAEKLVDEVTINDDVEDPEVENGASEASKKKEEEKEGRYVFWNLLTMTMLCFIEVYLFGNDYFEFIIIF